MGAQGSESDRNAAQAVSLSSSAVDLWAGSDSLSQRLRSIAKSAAPRQVSRDGVEHAAAQVTAAILAQAPVDKREYDEGPGRAAERPEGPPAAALPCLFTNNSNDEVQRELERKLRRVCSTHRKVAFALSFNCLVLLAIYGVERIGFLTLTFDRHIVDYKEAQKALHSLMTGVLRDRYREYIIVMERMDSGRIHYHLLVMLDQDIRTGFDFEALKAKDYRSASAYLRAEWDFWRETAPKYGFGRHELMPIRKTGEALAKYVGKYIGKHIEHRLPEDKGARLVRYSRGTNRARAQFSWCSPGAALWRTKLGLLCQSLGLTPDNYTEQLREWYGPRWCHALAPIIDSIKPLVYPSFWALQKDFPEMKPPPEELWQMPDCNPDLGGWANPNPEEARRSLLHAWAAALDERERQQHRGRRRESRDRRCSLTEFARSAFPVPRVAWIEQSAKYD